MRIGKYVFVFHSVTVLVALFFLSLALYTRQLGFLLASVWLFALTLTSAAFFMFRAYKRIITRIGFASDRLAELKFFQERRYEQLARRLDRTAADLQGLKASSDSAGPPLHSSRYRPNEVHFECFDELNTRIQRSERRILGSIENELLANDLRYKNIEEQLSKFNKTQR